MAASGPGAGLSDNGTASSSSPSGAGPVEAGRVLAFSDAVFAIAITLLTINLEVRPGLHGAAFVAALHQLLPALGAYALSFLILSQLWLAHHRIFGVIARVDDVVLRSNLLFLGLIALMPFPVRLLSDYSDGPWPWSSTRSPSSRPWSSSWSSGWT